MSRKNDFTPTSNELLMKFPSKEAAALFKEWLCGQGEQDYWTYAECQNTEYMVDFDYHQNPNEINTTRYGK